MSVMLTFDVPLHRVEVYDKIEINTAQFQVRDISRNIHTTWVNSVVVDQVTLTLRTEDDLILTLTGSADRMMKVGRSVT